MYGDNDIGDQLAAGGKLGRLTIYWGFTAFMLFYGWLSGKSISLYLYVPQAAAYSFNVILKIMYKYYF